MTHDWIGPVAHANSGLGAMVKQVAAALAVALLLPMTDVQAQRVVTGAVRDSADQRSLASVIVSALGSDGRVVARTLTTEQGGYRLRLPDQGGRVRFQRIGYAPRELEVPSDGTMNVTLSRVASMLDRVTTRGVSNCPSSRDAERAFGLWLQARVGLLATVIAREQSPARARTLVFQRMLPYRGDSTRMIRVRMQDGYVASPFVAARSPAAFVELGFRQEDDRGMFTYFGPDADVLLAEEFQNHYCFALAGKPPEPSLVGLRFFPASRKRGRVDIEGQVWVDSASHALAFIEFSYEGLESGAQHHRPGGRIHFSTMPNGSVLVDNWVLRVVQPIIETGPNLTRGGAPGEWGEQRPVPKFAAIDGGGELSEAIWPDGQRWTSPLGAWTVRLFDRTGRPVSGAQVRLDDTDYSAVTDSLGRATLEELLPGTYGVSIADTALLKIGVQVGLRMTLTVSRDSLLRSTLTVGTRESFAARACGVDASTFERGAAFFGRVLRQDGTAVPDAKWRIGGVGGTADERGMFFHCWGREYPSDIEVRAWTTRTDGQPDAVTRVILNGITVAPLVVAP